MGCVVKEKVASYPVVEAQVLSKKNQIWMFCTGIDSSRGMGMACSGKSESLGATPMQTERQEPEREDQMN
jgi:hypothetical protein